MQHANKHGLDESDDEIEYNWENLSAPVLGLFAEHDDNVNPNIPLHEENLNKYEKKFEFHIYPNTTHAFFNDTNTSNYNQDAANDAWEKVLNFYNEHI